MKTYLVVVVFLLLTTPLVAQPDYSKLPTLPVWYEINDKSYGQAMTYLPNFDTARKGFNALTHFFISGSPNATWYNRYQGDTEDMYSWPNRFILMNRGDFDGDGITDYMSGGAFEVYKGIVDGSPPMLPISSNAIKHSFRGPSFVADFNNDGKDDIVIRSTDVPTKDTNQIGSLLLGGADMTKLQLIPLPHTTNNDAECIIDAFVKGDGSGRMVTWKWDKDHNNSWFTLWNLQIDTNSSMPKVKYQYLAQWLVTSGNGDWIMNSFAAFHLNTNTEHTILIGRYTLVIDNDRFDLYHTAGYASPHLIFGTGITDVSQTGWLLLDFDTNKKLIYACYTGNPRHDTVAFAKFPFEISTAGDPLYATNVVGIGDINGDGLGDIAVAYGRWKFIIYLGTITPTSVETGEPYQKPTLQLVVSNPAKRLSPLLMTLRTANQSRVELYALGGGKIADLWRGTTDGETRTIEAALPPLAPGLYNLRLTDGRTTIDKALLISE